MTESKELISFPSRVYSMPSLHETQMTFGHMLKLLQLHAFKYKYNICKSVFTSILVIASSKRRMSHFEETSSALMTSFVESESTLGLTLSCASFLLFRSLILDGQADLHITSAKQIVTKHAIWSPFWGIPRGSQLSLFVSPNNLALNARDRVDPTLG